VTGGPIRRQREQQRLDEEARRAEFEDVQPMISRGRRTPYQEARAALVTIMGYEPQTQTEKGYFGKCAKELAEVGATYDEILRRAANWSKVFPGVTGSPSALVKWWGRLQ
jgi:hypothetical protein